MDVFKASEGTPEEEHDITSGTQGPAKPSTTRDVLSRASYGYFTERGDPQQHKLQLTTTRRYGIPRTTSILPPLAKLTVSSSVEDALANHVSTKEQKGTKGGAKAKRHWILAKWASTLA